MSKLQLMSENLITEYDSDITMLTGTENANFPISNLKHSFTTKVFRTNENNNEILIDLLQTRAADTFMLVGDALTGLGVTSVTIQGSATTNFTGITPISVDLDNNFNIGIVNFPEVSVRYWKINLVGGGTYNELSNIFLGKSTILENNSISISSFRIQTRDLSKTSTNNYGQEFTDKRSQQQEISGTIQYCNSEEVLLLDTLLRRHTDKTPLWAIIDSDNNITTDGKFRFSGYFSLQNSPTWTSTGYGLFNIPLTLRQII